jgi:hypothetical protein
VDETPLDGAWRLAEVVVPESPIDLTDVASTLTIDSAARRLSFRVSNFVARSLVTSGTKLTFAPEIKTLVRPTGVRLQLEELLESEFRSGLESAVDRDRLTLTATSGAVLRYQREAGEPASPRRGWSRR